MQLFQSWGREIEPHVTHSAVAQVQPGTWAVMDGGNKPSNKGLSTVLNSFQIITLLGREKRQLGAASIILELPNEVRCGVCGFDVNFMVLF